MRENFRLRRSVPLMICIESVNVDGKSRGGGFDLVQNSG